MLAAFQKRAARPPPDRQQLALFVRSGVPAGALERLGQQRVRQRLARDPLGVKRVGLAALARATSGAGGVAPAAFGATVTGATSESQLGNGLVQVDLRLALAGRALNAFDIRIDGQPLAGGGVEMTSSTVTLGTSATPALYSGRVTALAGTSIQAGVSTRRGSLVLLARLQVDPSSGSVTGNLTAQPVASQRLARGLVQRGILSEEHSKTLGILPTIRFPTVNPEPERDLRERLRDVLLADREPTEEEALLVGLLEPLGLIDSIVPKDQRNDARKHAKAVAEQGLTGTAVRDAIRAVQAAVIAAIAASTVVSAN